MSNNPFAPDDYLSRKVESARAALLLGVDSAVLRARETLMDITEAEFNWEPLSEAERLHDLTLPAEKKRVWRVFQVNNRYTYDYADGDLHPPPFTTIAWIISHIARTADMYLYCIKSGKAVGVEITWDDLPVYANLSDMVDYTFRALQQTRDYLAALDEREANDELNKLTPSPWGEMRPTYLNLWGGIIEHALQHTMQISVRKERIREGY